MKKSNNKLVSEAKILAKTNQLKKIVPTLGPTDVVKIIDEGGDGIENKYVEYLSDKSGEKPFILNGKKYEYVWAKYPDKKRDVGVYDFGQDLVLNKKWFHIINKLENKEDDTWTKLAEVLGVNEKDEKFAPDDKFGPDKNFGSDKLFEDDPTANFDTSKPQSTPDKGRDIKKLRYDVQKVLSKLDISTIKMYLDKIDKPIEQAEILAQFAEKIGVPRTKLPIIVKSLRAISENVQPKMTKQELIELVNKKANRRVIKTIKVKDIK